ncbi:diadenylate cyclase domain-containing protein, partial [Paenibacillus sp. TAF58]
MQQENCDISPMKEQLKLQLRHISAEIECSLDTLDNDENNCLLSRFDEIREAFKQVESIAASF